MSVPPLLFSHGQPFPTQCFRPYLGILAPEYEKPVYEKLAIVLAWYRRDEISDSSSYLIYPDAIRCVDDGGIGYIDQQR